ncbi:hypothetical protein SAMN04490239_1593 [Rhodococcus koreensis]|uniref:Uncharacterized protein n=1 Tax=Rhodococcus koreensis TaxID=99653 RepID=A0A1H4M311_9NOCA|nr:hypothetical protein SAMN04490239_1593 [Rhodococcus koreensis]
MFRKPNHNTSVVGATRTEAVPEKATSPRLITAVRSSAKASWATAIRDGGTSVACIDRDSSITRITMARFRGTFLSGGGPGQRDRQQQAHDHPGDRDAPFRSGTFRGDPVEECEVGEPQQVPVPQPLHQHVPDRDRERERGDGE